MGAKEIIRGISLEIPAGKVHAVMGPNGSGKSTLAKALLGHPSLRCSGSIMLGGTELIGLPPDERARRGLFLSFQHPEEVEGVKASALLRRAKAAREGPAPGMEQMVRMHEGLVRDAGRLGLAQDFVSRPLNVGCSGGERKRLEALQMLALSPRVVILDELDSGLDIDGVRLIAKAINGIAGRGRCFLIITHYPRILKYVKPDRVHVLVGGRIVESGGPRLAERIEKTGYAKYQGGEGAGR